MELIFSMISKVMADVPTYLTAIVVVFTSLSALISALITLFILIPGEQPEKTLAWLSGKMDSLTAWLAKYSRK
jgi:hypothetical protein